MKTVAAAKLEHGGRCKQTQRRKPKESMNVPGIIESTVIRLQIKLGSSGNENLSQCSENSTMSLISVEKALAKPFPLLHEDLTLR